MENTEVAQILSELTEKQWQAILSIPALSGIPSIPSIPSEPTCSHVIEKEEQSVFMRVLNILKAIGVPAHILGYKYLKEAILLAYQDEGYIHSVTKRLYPELAKKFNTTSGRVERAIRHAIETAFDRGDWDEQKVIFQGVYSPARGKPTNSEFIAIIVEYIRYN